MLPVEVFHDTSLIARDRLAALRVEWADECHPVVNIEEVAFQVSIFFVFTYVVRACTVRGKRAMC